MADEEQNTAIAVGPAVDEPQAQQPLHKKAGSQQSNISQPESTSIVIRSFRSLFGFRKTSLTLFSLITIFFVIASIPWAKHRALSLPETEPEILTNSWLDLQVISQKPHTYISHANDEVHDYILSRVRTLAKSSKYITVSDDREEGTHLFKIRKSWWNATSEYSPLHYYESNNVLVKIDGQDSALEGVLLSAHFDSVPTAYGTTDDGAGIASLLGILEHYVKTGERPLRTIVFNFNNNEEFGLFGADAFFEHPWSKLVKFFINLEGTGTGAERTVLFRTTDYETGKFYKNVRSPFATSMFQEGFASGLVHSETDYRVYASNGLRGFDIAFYKPRSLYHTASDSIQHTSKNALWHMLSNSLDLTRSLANTSSINDDTETQAVFFDVLGLTFIALPHTALYTINVILLAAVPVILIFFGVIISKRGIWTIGFTWAILPVSLVISGVGTRFVIEATFHVNPFIVSKDLFIPLFTATATFLFLNYLTLTFFNHFWPIHDFKLLITLEVFIGIWGVLLASTIRQRSSSIYTGEYPFTIYYAFYSLSVILGLFGISVASPRRRTIKSTAKSYGSIEENQSEHTEVDQSNADENAPLLSNTIPDVTDSEGEDQADQVVESGHPEHNSFTYDWSIQFFILVPINTLLSYISIWLILEATNQTIQESLESQYFVYSIVFLGAVSLSAPFLSFAYKLNYIFGLLLLTSIIVGGTLSLFSSPFSAEAPLKLRFAQTINLDDAKPTAEVELYGRQGYIFDVIKDLPSVKRDNVHVSCESKPDGNELCIYPGDRPFLVNGTSKENDFHSYLNVDILKSTVESSDPSPYAPLTAEILINAEENRFCSLSFNTTSYKSGEYGKSPLRLFTYYHDKTTNKSLDLAYVTVPSGPSKDSQGNEIFKWLSGIDEIHLHKLNWDQSSYHIGLQWIPKWLEDGEEQEPSNSPNNKLGVHISCYWGEYDAVSVVDNEPIRKLPAYDELLEYAPISNSFSNRYEGLVRIDKYIVL